MKRPAFLTFLRLSVISSLSALLTTMAAAATVAPLSVESMTALCDQVVLGTVSRTESRYSADRSQIFTYVTLGASEFLKGEGPAEVTFLLWGGVVGDDALTIVGSPVFTPGEEVVVFLSDIESRIPLAVPERRWLTGLSNGKWSVTTDANRAVRTAHRANAAAGSVAIPLEALRVRIAAAQTATLPSTGGR